MSACGPVGSPATALYACGKGRGGGPNSRARLLPVLLGDSLLTMTLRSPHSAGEGTDPEKSGDMPMATQQGRGRARILSQDLRLPRCCNPSGHTPAWTALPRLPPAADTFPSTTYPFPPPQSSQQPVQMSPPPRSLPGFLLWGSGAGTWKPGATFQVCLWSAGSPLSLRGNNLGTHL